MEGTRKIFARPALVALSALLVVASAGPAWAAPSPETPDFGPLIDRYLPYKGQSTCKPSPKPGPIALDKLLQTTYGPTWSNISRACDVGGRSEHKEGRALDWSMNAKKKAQRAKADAVIEWLLATDAYGNEHANARRLGLMYVLWNRRSWNTWDRTWSVYCRMTRKGCKHVDSGAIVHPHDDHVHFSFGWPGARKKTSFFRPDRSWVMGIADDPGQSGYRLLGGNAGVYAFGASHHGHRERAFLAQPAVGIASTPSGNGYWIVLRSGKVLAFGDAKHRGQVSRRRAKIVAIAATPTGKGYWLVAKRGSVTAFGDAAKHGRVPKDGPIVAGMGAAPDGQGYWIFDREGGVHAFGSAAHHGDASGLALDAPVASGAVHGAGGYWLALENGRIYAFGTAKLYGQATGVEGLGAVSAMLPSPSGKGYWVAGRLGEVAAYGDASSLGSL